MTLLRLATLILLTAVSLAACDCGDDPAASPADVQEPQKEERQLQSLPPPPAPPAAANTGPRDLGAAGDGVAGGGAVSNEAKEKATARGVGSGILHTIERSFDGDELVVVRNGVRRVSCDRACALEADCGFRDDAACRARSCEGDVRTPSRMDYCLALDDSVSCLDAAACSCAESCWKRGECTKDHSHDDECERTCRTLVTQETKERYRENRCVLESRCEDIAVCGSVSAP